MDGMWGNKFWTKLDKWVGWAKCAMSNGWGSPQLLQLPQLPQLLDLVTATSWFLDLFLTPKTGFKGARGIPQMPGFLKHGLRFKKIFNVAHPMPQTIPKITIFLGGIPTIPKCQVYPTIPTIPNHPQPSALAPAVTPRATHKENRLHAQLKVVDHTSLTGAEMCSGA